MRTQADHTVDAGADHRSATAYRSAPQLFVLFNSRHPLTPSSRHSLRDLDEVGLCRGAEQHAERVATESGRLLELRLADKRISSNHARLVRHLDRWTLVDTQSRNGTRKNGKFVTEELLNDGDLIELGNTLLLFREGMKTRADEPLDVISGAGQAVLGEVETLLPRHRDELQKLSLLAKADVPILILGESGTGKEVIARALAQLSGRTGQFVAVNCGAIPDTLVESELFGWKKGAFSGAINDHPGLIRSAHGGTLFLDEIGDLPQTSQAALLRVLQEREVRPVGSGQPTKVDVRVISATHQDLSRQVERRQFREDLFARISGFKLSLPPLRERREDIGLLVRQLLVRICGDRVGEVSFEMAAARRLLTYAWPRNVRQLENALRTAVVFADYDVIREEHLTGLLEDGAEPRPVSSSQGAGEFLNDAQEQHKEQLIALFAEHAGNVSAVARATGKARNQIQRWMKRYAINPEDYR